MLDIAAKELEIDPNDLEIVEGEVRAKGSPQKKIAVSDVAAAATWKYGELITGTGAAFKPYAVVDDDTGAVEIEPHSAISYSACVADVEVDDETGEVTVLKLTQVYDVGRAINPTLVEGQIQGGAMMGLGLGLLEACYPYYPSPEHRGSEFGTYLAPGLAGMPEIDISILENPSEDGPFGAKAIGEMASNSQAAGDRHRRPRRRRRLGHGLAGDAGEGAPRPRGEARAASGGKARRLRRGALAGRRRRPRRTAQVRGERWLTARRRFGAGTAWTRSSSTTASGCTRSAATMSCSAASTYEPGKRVPRHAHEQTEQLMVIMDGAVDMTIGDEQRTLVPGDVVCVNRGIEHELYSANGVTFFEALAPVPLDHVPDRERDLVLGDENGARHVER